jgi:hypothetical protein
MMRDQVSEAVRAAKTRVVQDVSTQGLGKLLAAYYNPAGRFAGATFDTLGANPPNKIIRDDLLAVTLLDERWTPAAVRRLLGADSRSAAAMLAQITAVHNLWDVSDEELAAVDPLWKLLMKSKDGVGRTRASKLLARKRPQLVPITDTVIVRRIGARGETWAAIRYCLQDESLRRSVERLRPPQAEGASVLRLLDVALWMLHSQSKAAKKARLDAGINGSS